MNLSLSYSLGRSMVYTRGDADALAYIAAVEGAGTSVSGIQKTAINDFYVSAKADSYYTSLKRLYLPIWGNAAANAIDMIGLTSGTFVGGVTHGAGYIEGDGTTGYFTTGAASNTLMTTASGMIGTLNYTAIPSANMITAASGAFTSGTSARCGSENSGSSPRALWLGANVTQAGVGSEGIQLACRLAGTTIHGKRNTAGYTENTNTVATTASMSATNFVFLSSNASAGFASNRVGAGFVSDGVDNATRQSFTTALKDLWETSTGLVLP